MLKNASGELGVVGKQICLLGECPVWDAKRNVIIWVDILKGEIHEYSPGKKTQQTLHVNQMIGSIAICRDGNFVGAVQNGFVFIDRLTAEVKMIADPEAHLPNNRFNEGKCDPAGRFWAGTMALSEEGKAGSVYTLEDEWTIVKKIEEVTISNGMAWSLDQETFFYIDSPTFAIVSYDYNKKTGHISNKKIVRHIPEEEGYPDGMTIDNEGMLWIAHWDGWQVTRWNPNSGEKLLGIQLPVARVTSCTFGGEYLQDLYITSARHGLSDTQLQKQPLAGSLFVLPGCGFKGIPAFEYQGDCLTR